MFDAVYFFAVVVCGDLVKTNEQATKGLNRWLVEMLPLAGNFFVFKRSPGSALILSAGYESNSTSLLYVPGKWGCVK